LLPDAGKVLDAAERIEIGGGWVHARASGVFSDPSSTLHRRDRFGTTRLGNYFSIDTGKYSTAPFMAGQIAAQLG
jgi:hypothetical protein